MLAKTLFGGRETPLNVFATLARHPLLLRRVNALGGAFLAYGTLDARERELLILRVAARVRSRYELAQHVVIGRRVAVSDEEIDALLGDLGAYAWSPDDLALLRFTDDLLERDVVSDEAWDAVAGRLDTQQLLELLFMVGFYRMLAGYLRSVGVELESELELPPAASGPDWR